GDSEDQKHYQKSDGAGDSCGNRQYQLHSQIAGKGTRFGRGQLFESAPGLADGHVVERHQRRDKVGCQRVDNGSYNDEHKQTQSHWDQNAQQFRKRVAGAEDAAFVRLPQWDTDHQTENQGGEQSESNHESEVATALLTIVLPAAADLCVAPQDRIQQDES